MKRILPKLMFVNCVNAVIFLVLVWASLSPVRLLTMAVPGGSNNLCANMMAMDTVNLHNPQSGNYIFAFVGKQGDIFYMETDAAGKSILRLPVSNSAGFMPKLAENGWLLSCPAKQIKPLIQCESSTVWALAGKAKAENTQELWFFSQNMERENCAQ